MAASTHHERAIPLNQALAYGVQAHASPSVAAAPPASFLYCSLYLLIAHFPCKIDHHQASAKLSLLASPVPLTPCKKEDGGLDLRPDHYNFSRCN
jgi:hypothetical protein